MSATHATCGPWQGHRGKGSRGAMPELARMARAMRGRGGPWGGSPWGPPWAGPWGGPGARFRRGPKAGRGDVRAAVLLLLAEQPMHGYQLIQEIGERSGGLWRPSPGSVYPMLSQLEDEGLVRDEPREGKRVFHLTEAGRAYVEERREELAAVWDTFAESETDERMKLGRDAMQVDAAVMQVAHTGSESQIAEARRLLAETRRRLYRILAEEDPAGEGPAGDVADQDGPGPL